jgi:non-ribosomal peptide synthetase component F
MISQRGLNLFGFLTLILVFVNMFLLVGNQSLQRSVAERQQLIMQSIQMQGSAREIVGALANLAVRTEDEQLKQLLTKHGVTVTVNQTPTAGAAVKGK